MFSFTAFSHASPYPPALAERPNPCYAAEMLSNIGACSSEMSAVSLYLYNNIILLQINPDFAHIFEKISVVEMHHLHIFGQLAQQLGADPRLWTCSGRRPCYWSPACNHYPREPKALLRNALSGEQETIRKYQQQAQHICDAYIVDILQRIILDEQLHVEIFREMLTQLS